MKGLRSLIIGMIVPRAAGTDVAWVASDREGQQRPHIHQRFEGSARGC